MAFLAYLLISAAVLSLAYLFMGRLLVRIFSLTSTETTPACTMRDGLDYEPARTSYLLPQHFSAIAAAGPIVGPILAGIYFGWGPTWLWILFGSIFIGGIHDFTALIASVRHRAQSVAQIVREYMNPRAHVLFLIFIWLALIYVIIAFADVTAGAFVQKGSTAEGSAPGPAVASSSIIYLLLAVFMGLVLRFTPLGPVRAKMIFLPLVAVAILIGPYIPIPMESLVPGWNPQQIWGYLLLGYCFVAALAPVWILLQPRGELGGYFLYIVMITAVLGISIGALTGGIHIAQPFFLGWTAQQAGPSPLPLFPMLFITVACGACSGFHSIVASGTTSKQLKREIDARPIAYGGMLLEGFFACLSLATVMILTETKGKTPDFIYASGIADFGARIVLPFYGHEQYLKDILLKFGLMCFATFVFDTLDACTRLSRYVLMELFGWKTRNQAAIATALCLVIPAVALSLRMELNGAAVPIWKVFWGIFGSSNQLLAALTLLGVTVWMAKRRLPYWLTLAPTLFMMGMTVWSLAISIPPYLALWKAAEPIAMARHMQFGVTMVLLVLALWLVVEAIITWRTMMRPRPDVPLAQESLA